ncbi:hypothetical protein TELCIR_10821 [Teladorsagia circumcincta]|uniref:Uncharacterized protein n=1 Tax=Teladorsagia circumcincta TaxID=45464 RepID=A0A2G9UB26_TELCI|nr:hypothetical protein TELCIR_10821 [Teladorsagia circumcincta]
MSHPRVNDLFLQLWCFAVLFGYNQLQTLPENVFMNSFLPRPNDRRVIYCCGNPWFCNNDLLWFRQLLRDNLDIDIEKPGCLAVCAASPTGCPAEGTPLRYVFETIRIFW